MFEGFRGFRGNTTGPCLSCFKRTQIKNGYCHRCRVKFRLGTREHAIANIVEDAKAAEALEQPAVKKVKKVKKENKPKKISTK